jgi:hypothetical protein
MRFRNRHDVRNHALLRAINAGKRESSNDGTGRRSRRFCFCRRAKTLKEPAIVPRDTEYSSMFESEIPIVVQHTRLDSRHAEVGLMTTTRLCGRMSLHRRIAANAHGSLRETRRKQRIHAIRRHRDSFAAPPEIGTKRRSRR